MRRFLTFALGLSLLVGVAYPLLLAVAPVAAFGLWLVHRADRLDRPTLAELRRRVDVERARREAERYGRAAARQ
jgi:hypothetical protein